MSQVTKSRTGPRGNGRSGGGAIAVVHTQEGRQRLLIARFRDRWEVVESRTLQGLESAVLTPVFEEHEVKQVVRIAPGRESIARCVQVPDGDDAGLAGAVGLMAEAELPSNLPSYRRAAGVLPAASNADVRTGLLTGWMQASKPPSPLTMVPEVWVSPIACLSMLRGETGRAAVYCESSEGVICLLVPGPEKTIARVTVEEPGSGEEWGGQVAQAVEETAQIAGVAATSAGAFNNGARATSSRRLLLEPGSVSGLRARVSGVRDDQGWLDEFGLAVGAVLIAGSDLASVRSLAGLHAEAPRQMLSPIEAGTQWIARPRNAWAVIAASLALMLLAPWGLAFARSAVLKPRADKLRELNVGREGAEKKAAMFEQLDKSRWPMTKLMADISTAAPKGIVISQININVGQGISIKGVADSPEDLTDFQANLTSTRVFGNVSIGRQAAKGSGYEFDMTAKVTENVQAVVKLTEKNDYAASPLAERLYGAGASNTVAAAPEKSEGGSSRRERGERRGDRASGGESTSRTETESRRPATTSTASTSVPPPLTDADIAKMDFKVSMTEWSTRKRFVQVNSKLDSATKQRLNDEIDKVRAQMDKMKNAPAAAAAAPPAAAGAAPAAPAPATPPASGGSK